MHRFLRGALLAVAPLVTVCSDAPVQLEQPLLAFVPEGSAYVVASGEPFPAEFLRRSSELQRRLAGATSRQLTAAADPRADLATTSTRLLESLLELTQMESEAGASQPFVVYARAMTPVLRTRLAQPEAALARLDALAAEPGSELQARGEGDERSWRLDLGDAVGLITLSGTLLSAGLASPDDESALLAHLLSREPAGGGAEAEVALAEARARHGFAPHVVGVLDTRRALTHWLDQAESLTPACRDEIVGLTAQVPRLVAGYEDVRDTAVTARIVLELEPSIGDQLSSWTVPMPALGQPQELLGMGVAIDAPSVLKGAMRWQQQLTRGDSACGPLLASSDPSAVAKALIALGFAGNPLGLRVAVDGAPADWNAPDAAWSVSALLKARTPHSTTVLAAQALPLTPLLESQGQPAQLTLPAAPEGLRGTTWGILTDDAVAIATGADAETRLQRLVKAPAPQDGMLFGVDIDVRGLSEALRSEDGDRLFESILQTQAAAGANAQELARARAEIEQSRELLRSTSELFERVAFSVRATPGGLELRETVELR